MSRIKNIYLKDGLDMHDLNRMKRRIEEEKRMEFTHGQRVSVKDAPSNKKKRYGTILWKNTTTSEDNHVYIHDEDRYSNVGEISYLILFTPNGGGHWWSDKYLTPVRAKVNNGS